MIFLLFLFWNINRYGSATYDIYDIRNVALINYDYILIAMNLNRDVCYAGQNAPNEVI
jgi:hypothetical protein